MSESTNRSSHAGKAGLSARPPGLISVHHVYHIDEAKLRLGWTDAAYRAARRRGLQVLTSGKRAYIDGQEIRRFLSAENASREDA